MSDFWQHALNFVVVGNLYWFDFRIRRLEERRRLHDLDDVIRELGIEGTNDAD